MSIKSKLRMIRAKRAAQKRECQGLKPHTCQQCGKKLGMSEAYLAHGALWCKKHKPF